MGGVVTLLGYLQLEISHSVLQSFDFPSKLALFF